MENILYICNNKIMKGMSFIVIMMVWTNLFAQSYELTANGDTINKIDTEGKRQGKWIIMGKHKPGTCYQPEQKAEEGKYIDSKKNGLWIEYYCNGNLKGKIQYANGRPDGYCIIYHENGKIQEEGQWSSKLNRWVGKYKLYYDNGQVQHEFNFNQNGKREGPAKYFYENGQLAIEGNFQNGQETGVFKEYYENGDVKAEKTFNAGQVDVASIKEYQPKKPYEPIKDEVKKAPPVLASKDEAPNEAQKSKGPLILNGFHTLYNKNKQVSKVGEFKDNRLINGKWYIYDENGILLRVAVYKDGFYVGDTQADN